MTSARSDLWEHLSRLHSLQKQMNDLAVQEGVRLQFGSLLHAAVLQDRESDASLVFEVTEYREPRKSASPGDSDTLLAELLQGPPPSEYPGASWWYADLKSVGPVQCRISTETPDEAGPSLQARISALFENMVAALRGFVTCAAAHPADVRLLVFEFIWEADGDGCRYRIRNAADGSGDIVPMEDTLARELLWALAKVAPLHPRSAAAAIVHGMEGLPLSSAVFMDHLGFEVPDPPPLRIADAWEHFVKEINPDLCWLGFEIELMEHYAENGRPGEGLAILAHVLEVEVGPAQEQGWEISTFMPHWLDLRDRLRASAMPPQSVEDELRFDRERSRHRAVVATQRAQERFSEVWGNLGEETRGHIEYALHLHGELEEGLVPSPNMRAHQRRTIAVEIGASLEKEWHRQVWEPYLTDLRGEMPAQRQSPSFEQQLNLLVRDAGNGSYVSRQGGDAAALRAVVNGSAYRTVRRYRNRYVHPSGDRPSPSEDELQSAIAAALGPDRSANWLLCYFKALPAGVACDHGAQA